MTDIRPSACSWCNSKDFRRGSYLTFKGYNSTMKHNFHAICPEHSKKLSYVVAMGTMHLDNVYALLKENEEKLKEAEDR